MPNIVNINSLYVFMMWLHGGRNEVSVKQPIASSVNKFQESSIFIVNLM